MKRILVTGGTTFVSRYTARYFLERGYEVYVLNRNTKPQEEGVRLIEGDRHSLGSRLKGFSFDVVADVTAYDAPDVTDLLDALGPFGQYIMISSSAVYPDTGTQPFREEAPRFVPVHGDIEQRSYFSFYDYKYFLDVSRQRALLPALTPLSEGLQEAFVWYTGHRDQVVRKNFIPYIDAHLRPLYRGE